MPLLEHLQLALTSGLGPITIARLIESLGSAERATEVSITELQRIEGIGSIKAQTIVSGRRAAAEQAKREIDRATELGFTILCREDSDYPPMLAAINDAPVVLYVRGSLQPRDLHAVSIVGSRKCSLYGREQSERFAALLAGAGVTVISGGARGIDSAAHRGALSHSLGRTIAVLGCGLDICYPPENAALFEQIAQRGAVVSEYPLGTPPTPENFPRRNRIISGMSRAVLVIEADVRSGALITARLAADDHNRPVLAIPGRLDNPLSAGPHKLIRDGATLVTNLEEILESLGPMPDSVGEPIATVNSSPAPSAPPRIDVLLSPSQQMLFEHLGAEPMQVDQLVDLTQLPPSQVMQDLTLLTLRGVVKRTDGQSYAKARQKK